MMTRIITGNTVQATSRPVWWVMREGVGLAFSLKRTTI